MVCDLHGGFLLVLTLLQSSVGFRPKEVCLMQVDEGPCNDDITRFYYNTITQKCEEFSYSGCGGNSNNFRNFVECQKTCFKIPKIPRLCRFEKQTGPCRALFKRYFFNMTSMQCEAFFFSGCQGNENNFESLQSCIEYCRPPKTIPVICQDALDKGTCSASIPRYYYNSLTKTCQEFMYTGCGGSTNNFNTKRGCMDVCGARVKKPGIKVHKQFLRRTMGQPQRVNRPK